MPLNNQTQVIPLPLQPLRLPPNPSKNSITHRAGKIVRQHRFHIGDRLLRLCFQLSHHLPCFLFGIPHCSRSRDKVPWQDLAPTVMPAFPNRSHGHFGFLRCDAAGMHKGVAREHIIKRGHSISRFRLKEQTKVLSVPINGRQHPEYDLAFKESVSIEQGLLRTQ